MTYRFAAIVLFCYLPLLCSAKNQYQWLDAYNIDKAAVNRIPAPPGYTRTKVEQDSFADWLRHLPMKTDTKTVMLYNGQPKLDQSAQHALIDIDIGDTNLQQCADAVIRLRAEYLHSNKKFKQIHFNYTSGDRIDFIRWKQGERPAVHGNQVIWKQTTSINDSYTSFRRYLNNIFMYAGTYSLSKELVRVSDLNEIQPGDVLIQGGFPGHCVIVIDAAESDTSDEKLFLLAQSYMPAQNIHILKNPRDSTISPWYTTQIDDEVIATPDCLFWENELKRFK